LLVCSWLFVCCWRLFPWLSLAPVLLSSSWELIQNCWAAVSLRLCWFWGSQKGFILLCLYPATQVVFWHLCVGFVLL
jgi:hypothetical protein